MFSEINDTKEYEVTEQAQLKLTKPNNLDLVLFNSYPVALNFYLD